MKMTRLMQAVLLLWMVAAGNDQAYAWDPIYDLTGRSLKGNVERRIDRIGNSAEKFLHNPVDYTIKFPAKMLGEICTAVPNLYEGALQGQVANWWTIQPNLLMALQPYYSVDLRTVRFAVGIRTSNGQAQTFGNTIYFPTDQLNLNHQDDMRWLLHELEHVVQFANSSWGDNGKLCEYLAKGFTHGFDQYSIDMEQAADRKANWLLPFAMGVISGPINQAPAGAGPVPYPLPTLARNEIWIRNENPFPVSFYLRTELLGEMVLLQPFEQRVFRGAPSDWWFYIEVPNVVRPSVSYTLLGGTKQHLAPQQPFGYIDVFWSR